VILAPTPQRTDAPVVAYRVFRVRTGGKLTSATRGDLWTTKLHEATCAEANHPAPQFGCHCGIHAFGSLATAERYSGRRWLKWPGLTSSTVIGAVLLYSAPGRPIVGGELARRSGVRTGRGALQYRAPYGQLVALLDSPAARRAGERLGVPVLPKRDAAGRPAFERFAREHGTELEAQPPDAAPTRSPTPATFHPLVNAIRRQRGRWHVALVVGLALALAVLVAGRLSWLVARPTLRVAWWLAWWGGRLALAVGLFCLLLPLSFLGLLPERR
jgi:hypothetical protein